MTDSKQLPVLIEFSGGAELLFSNQKKLNIQLDVDDAKPWTLRKLIHHLRDKYLQERPELFCNGDTVRPGILVLVNDTDWELLGDLDYRIQPNDNILFISTLHGG